MNDITLNHRRHSLKPFIARTDWKWKKKPIDAF